MNLLELFSGTKSVGTIAKSLGFNVISLDLKNADINTDILEWDYKQFDRNHFEFIWSSPPCTEYSIAKTQGIRNIEYANSIVLKTIEIIKYFNPKYFVIENPQTGLLKHQEFMDELILKMLIIVNMDFIIERGLGYGITLQLGNLENYVKRIVATSGIINMLKLHNGYHQALRKIGETIQQYISRKTYTKYLAN